MWPISPATSDSSKQNVKTHIFISFQCPPEISVVLDVSFGLLSIIKQMQVFHRWITRLFLFAAFLPSKCNLCIGKVVKISSSFTSASANVAYSVLQRINNFLLYFSCIPNYDISGGGGGGLTEARSHPDLDTSHLVINFVCPKPYYLHSLRYAAWRRASSLYLWRSGIP